MDLNPAPPPVGCSDAVYYAWLRRKAHAMHCWELQQFDWLSLDEETARKLHALLPRRD